MRKLHRDERRKNTNRIKKQKQEMWENYKKEEKQNSKEDCTFVLHCIQHDDIFEVESLSVIWNSDAADETVYAVQKVQEHVDSHIGKRFANYPHIVNVIEETMRQCAPEHKLSQECPTVEQLEGNKNHRFDSPRGACYRRVKMLYCVPTEFPREEYRALQPYSDEWDAQRLCRRRTDELEEKRQYIDRRMEEYWQVDNKN